MYFSASQSSIYTIILIRIYLPEIYVISSQFLYVCTWEIYTLGGGATKAPVISVGLPTDSYDPINIINTSRLDNIFLKNAENPIRNWDIGSKEKYEAAADLFAVELVDRVRAAIGPSRLSDDENRPSSVAASSSAFDRSIHRLPSKTAPAALLSAAATIVRATSMYYNRSCKGGNQIMRRLNVNIMFYLLSRVAYRNEVDGIL